VSMYCESCRSDFEFVFRAIPGIVWEADPKTLRFTFVSDPAIQLLGYSRGAWLSDGFWSGGLHPADRDAAHAARRTVVAAGMTIKSEYRMIAADGSTVWFDDTASAEVNADGTIRLRGVMIDVTKQKHLEQRLVQMERTAYAGTLALGAVHDFNNVPTELNLQTVVKKTVELLEGIVGKHIELVARMVTEVGSIRAHVVQIEQVIFNLVLNARDAMPEGGRVTIETFSVGSKAFLAVSDTGRGMDAETVARALELGFTTKPYGSGIGLATVHSIVKGTGGEISIQSQPGTGTTVRIGFPLSAAASSNPRDRETILLVEDNDLVRDVIGKMLKHEGYQVLQAGSGDEALQILRHSETPPVDLLMTELLLPGLGGIALADELLKVYPHLRVLFMSGYANEEFIHFQRPQLRRSFIQKPFDSKELAHQLRQILDSTQEF
jgi:two-component system cell cycle sensor histidine kinase/response regulator CckA